MRQFILHYTFGRYWWKLPDRSFWLSTKYFKKLAWLGQSHYNCTSRGPFWYFNGFLLIAIVWILTGRPEWLILWPTIAWSFMVLYLGFPLKGLGYYERYPAQWEELDEEQKWYYGNAATSGDLSKAIPFTDSQFEEWAVIRARMRKKYRMT